MLPLKTTSSYFSVNTSFSGPTVRTDVRWASQAVVIQGLDYLPSTAEQKLWYLGASVMLFSCSGRVWFAMRRKTEKAAAVQTWIPAGLQQMWCVCVRRSVERGFHFATLWFADVRCSRPQTLILSRLCGTGKGRLPPAIV